eukprot:PhF_6_TR25632/c0_g1_i1/m.36033
MLSHSFKKNSPDEFVFIDINHADLMEPKHDEMVKKILKETGCFEKMVRRDQNPTSLQTPLGQLWGKAGFAGRLYVSYCRTFSGVEAGALWPCAQSPWPNVTAVDTLIEKLDQSLSARPAVPTNVFVSQGVLTPNDNMIKDSLNPVKLGTMNSIGDMAKVANSAAVSWFYSPTTPNNRNVLIVDFVDMMNTTETVIRMNIPTTIVYANYGGIDVTEQTRKISTIVGALRWGRGSYASTLAIVPLGDENTNPFVVVTQQHTTKEMEVHLYSDSDPIHLLWGTDQKRVPSKPIPKGTQYGNKVIAANYGGLDVNAKVQQLWTASGVSYRGEDIPKLMGILPSGPPKPLVIIFQQMTSSTMRVGVSVLYDFPGEVATIAVRSVGAAGKTKSSVLPESAIIAIKEPELRALFAKFDTDNSGFLFRDEFRKEYLAMEAAVGVNLTTKQADALFSKYDANGDGKLFFDEFALLMLSRTKM